MQKYVLVDKRTMKRIDIQMNYEEKYIHFTKMIFLMISRSLHQIWTKLGDFRVKKMIK